jgi:hypothetical protein
MPVTRRTSGFPLTAVVGELEGDAEVAGAELAHNLLEDVFVLGDDADGVALNGGLGFELGLLDHGDDLFGGVGVDALLELDLLADGGVGGRLELSYSRFLREMPRLTMRWERISVTAFREYSLALASWMVSSPSSRMVDLVSFRSKRVWTSLEA